jgi:(R,R)-butanediol dehydrogenase/meso-butanediol dehydrogenase/diacetyl reductase
MQALRWHAAHDVRLEEVEPPTPGPGRTLVEVNLCGICGSDLHEYRDGPNLIRSDAHPLTGQAPPITLGHEFSGVVKELGVAASSPPVGTRVTADACWRCGSCSACQAGDYHRCRLGGSIGLHSDGAFAAYVVVPDYCLVPIDERVSDEVAALTEPFAVALHALERGGLSAGQDLLVFGFGPLGAAAALTGRALGARVFVVEKDDRRAAVAAELGCVVIEAGDDADRRARRLIGAGGADVVVDSTAVPAVLAQAVESAKRGGRIVLVGLGGPPADLRTDRLVLFERSIVGSLGYRHDLPRVMRMFADGFVDPSALIGDVVPLGELPGLLEQLTVDTGGRIKIMVDPRG